MRLVFCTGPRIRSDPSGCSPGELLVEDAGIFRCQSVVWIALSFGVVGRAIIGVSAN